MVYGEPKIPQEEIVKLLEKEFGLKVKAVKLTASFAGHIGPGSFGFTLTDLK